jgi:hypothetical protein
MTSGPSQHQVLLRLDLLPPTSKLPAIIASANRSLGKGNLWVNSCYAANGGLTLLTFFFFLLFFIIKNL